METKNYTYGLRPPVVGSEMVLEQMKLAHQYRNKLCEIELHRRARVDDTLRDLCPGLLECEADLARVTTAIEDAVYTQKKRNQQARGMTDDTDTRQTLAELRAERKALAATRKMLRTGSFAEAATKAALRGVDDDAAAAVRAARAANGVYWGTYLIVEQACDSFRKGAPPVYRGYRGEGRIAVQLQNGMDWKTATSGRNNLLRIVHTPQAEVRTNKRGQPIPAPAPKKRAQQYTLSIRVGSDGRAPIWAEFPLILHRTPPDDCQIMWAIVARRIVAGKERWQLTLSIRGEAGVFAGKSTPEHGIVGIDVGYRVLSPAGELRVAYAVGDDGKRVSYTIPVGKMAEFAKVEDLQSIRDQHHNEARADLKAWLDERDDLPEWITEATKTMHAWRRLSRLDRLVVEWREKRIDGDDAILARLETWRTKERHLWQYQEQLRDQLLAWRKDYYRRIAKDLTSRYRCICVEKLDLRELHDVLRPKDEQTVPATIRRAAKTASLSTLLQCLKESAVEMITVPAEDTTKRCHACGGMCDWDAAAHVRHRCEHCGTEWDQDRNAAENILASGRVTPGPLADDSGGETWGNGKFPNGKKVSRRERFATARKQRISPGK